MSATAASLPLMNQNKLLVETKRTLTMVGGFSPLGLSRAGQICFDGDFAKHGSRRKDTLSRGRDPCISIQYDGFAGENHLAVASPSGQLWTALMDTGVRLLYSYLAI